MTVRRLELRSATLRQEAGQDFVDALEVLNQNRRGLHLPPLDDADATWKQRIDGVMACLEVAFFEREDHVPPNLESVAKAGAHLVAMYVAAIRAHEARVESGDE